MSARAVLTHIVGSLIANGQYATLEEVMGRVNRLKPTSAKRVAVESIADASLQVQVSQIRNEFLDAMGIERPAGRGRMSLDTVARITEQLNTVTRRKALAKYVEDWDMDIKVDVPAPKARRKAKSKNVETELAVA